MGADGLLVKTTMERWGLKNYHGKGGLKNYHGKVGAGGLLVLKQF